MTEKERLNRKIAWMSSQRRVTSEDLAEIVALSKALAKTIENEEKNSSVMYVENVDIDLKRMAQEKREYLIKELKKRTPLLIFGMLLQLCGCPGCPKDKVMFAPANNSFILFSSEVDCSCFPHCVKEDLCVKRDTFHLYPKYGYVYDPISKKLFFCEEIAKNVTDFFPNVHIYTVTH